MTAASCVYEGWVRHRRLEPMEHGFRYPLYLLYLDLDELPAALERSRLFAAIARFRRADHLGDPARPLRDEVLDLVAARTGARPAGPVRVLTQLRHFGIGFNPVSFYYCFDADEQLAAVAARVTNTPWGESHDYVLGERVGKELHVSPFLGMDSEYACRFSVPGRTLRVDIESSPGVRRHAVAAAPRARRPAPAPPARALSGPAGRDARADLPAGAAPEAARRALPPASRAMKLARAIVLGALRSIRSGRVELVERGAVHVLGPPDADLSVTIHVNDPSAWRRCLRGSHGVAEAYLDGAWDCDDLVTLVRIGAREIPRLDPLRRAILPLRRLLERVPRNTLRAAPPAHRRPLRPRQRPVRRVPRRDDELLVRAVRRARAVARRPLRRRSSSASAGSSSSRRTTTCWRSAAAGAASRSTPRPTTAAA